MIHRIMRRMKWIGLIPVLLLFPTVASAQGDGMIFIVSILEQVHKVADLSLGFSTTRTTNTPSSERIIPIGMQFGISGHKGIGGEIDLAIQSRTPAGQNRAFNMFEYLFGPRFNAHKGRATLYGHILAGGVYQWKSSKENESSTYEGGGFAITLGGGLDVDVNKGIAIRVAQADWIPIRQNGCWINNTFRFGFGLVFRSTK
jgi:hypothetical protein